MIFAMPTSTGLGRKGRSLCTGSRRLRRYQNTDDWLQLNPHAICASVPLGGGVNLWGSAVGVCSLALHEERKVFVAAQKQCTVGVSAEFSVLISYIHIYCRR